MLTKEIVKILKVCLVISILGYGLFLRSQTFWLPHWRGDQEHYLALAMKLDHFGIDGYNLRGVDVNTYFFSITKDFEGLIAEVKPAKPGDKGYILTELANHGTYHYDVPLYFIAPGFPLALSLSNRLFTNGMYAVAHDNIGKNVRHLKPKPYFQSQFFAVIVPLLFGLALILVVFLIGRQLFSYSVGIYASFIMSVNAVDLLASQRVWTDEMASFFVALTVLFFIHSLHKGKDLYCLLTGLACGAATMTKQNTAIIALPIILYMGFEIYRRGNKDIWAKVRTFVKRVLLFAVPFAVVIMPWFLKVYQTYGTFFYLNPELTALENTDWSAMVINRPPSLIFYSVGLLTISPIFLFAFVPLKQLFGNIKGLLKAGQERVYESRSLLLLLWAAVFFIYFIFFYTFGERKEHRYMLPAYPALALLSASVVPQAREFMRGRLGKNQIILSELSIIIVLAVYAGYAIWLGNGTVLADGALILFPF